MIPPGENDASNGEGDVEEHVETEVSSEALVVSRGIYTLKYLRNMKDIQQQRIKKTVPISSAPHN